MAKSKTEKPDADTQDSEKAPKAEKKPVESLVLNRRGGVYQCVKTSNTGAKAGSGVERLKIETRRMWPGLNLVDLEGFKVGDEWAATLKRRIKDREIQIIKGKDGLSAFAALDRETAVDHVGITANTETLHKLLEVETREDVVMAIREQIRINTDDKAAVPRASLNRFVGR